MKKIMIFSGSTGNGHNQVAKVLKEQLADKGAEVLLVDILKESSPWVDLLINDGYSLIVSKFPRLYGRLYDFTNDYPRSNRLIRRLTLEEKRFFRRVVEPFSPDLILTTHPFGVILADHLKNKQKLKAPVVSVITDFHFHESYVSQQVDAYISGGLFPEESLQEKGIEPEKIHPYGIPVKPAFYARKKSRILHLETLLLMGGSLGMKDMVLALKDLRQVEGKLKIHVVCGNNEKLYQTIEPMVEDFPPDKQIILHGFTQKIPELFEASDLLITKPGGITTTEALVMGLPMVIPYYFHGQEKENLRFLQNHGLVLSPDGDESLVAIINRLKKNPEILSSLQSTMAEFTSSYSLGYTLKLIENHLRQQHSA
ncbi:MAG: hypothetical protein AVO33_02035 [delta proteobacterium ML8_F1]|nr:MAG: hypothetical protein AVO33_02035 [delta proteobacterium ML8_F1]